MVHNIFMWMQHKAHNILPPELSGSQIWVKCLLYSMSLAGIVAEVILIFMQHEPIKVEQFWLGLWDPIIHWLIVQYFNSSKQKQQQQQQIMIIAQPYKACNSTQTVKSWRKTTSVLFV